MNSVAVQPSRAGCSGVLRSSTQRRVVTVRAAADNQLLKRPELKKSDGSQPSSSAAAAPAVPGSTPATVTIEWQRQRAKEMRQYFIDLKTDELRAKSQVFGWTKKNEISNGRWVMFGLLVGLLTEYATGVDFPDQLALMVSYLGIADLD